MYKKYRYGNIGKWFEGIGIVAFMMLGLKPLNWDDYDRLPEDGQGRCCFAISKRAWEAACRKYPMLK